MSTDPGTDIERTPVPGVPLDVMRLLLRLPREVRINCANFLRASAPEAAPHPDHLHGYSCADYFTDGWAEKGFYDEVAHYWVVEPMRELSAERRNKFFAVGGPGVDGIRFCYRYGHEGLWAFYPITEEFVAVAKSVNELVEKWRAGALTV